MSLKKTVTNIAHPNSCNDLLCRSFAENPIEHEAQELAAEAASRILHGDAFETDIRVTGIAMLEQRVPYAHHLPGRGLYQS